MADSTGVRRALTYDPGADAADRYPDWVIRHRDLRGIPEVLCRRRKVILIDHADHWPVKRCSLAHAVAHLDLGHSQLVAGLFERDQENAANQLAARRLIPVRRLAEVLCWTRYRTEIAAELQVDLSTLAVREQHLHVSERALLRRTTTWLEETA